MSSYLKKQLIRLGDRKPSLRKHLRPILSSLKTGSLDELEGILRDIGLPDPGPDADPDANNIGSRLSSLAGLEVADHLAQYITVKDVSRESDQGVFEIEMTLKWPYVAWEGVGAVYINSTHFDDVLRPSVLERVGSDSDFQKHMSSNINLQPPNEMDLPLREKIAEEVLGYKDRIGFYAEDLDMKWDRQGVVIAAKGIIEY